MLILPSAGIRTSPSCVFCHANHDTHTIRQRRTLEAMWKQPPQNLKTWKLKQKEINGIPNKTGGSDAKPTLWVQAVQD